MDETIWGELESSEEEEEEVGITACVGLEGGGRILKCFNGTCTNVCTPRIQL